MKKLIIASEIQNITHVEDFVESLISKYRITSEVKGKLSLAVTEAVNNAVIHGNQKNPAKNVTIKAWLTGRQLQVSVEDEGKGFDYQYQPDPTNPENLYKDSGRGLYMIRTLSDWVAFKKNGAKIILSFRIQKISLWQRIFIILGCQK